MFSILFIASGFSIFAITNAWDFLCLFIIVFSFFTSSADLTKESPIHSIFCSKRKLRSILSFFVKQGNEISVFGRFTPLFDFNRPPKTTFSFTLFFPLLFSTNKDNFPSSKRTLSPFFTSFAKLE